MIIGNPLPFVEAYVEHLSASLESHQPKAGLSWGQKAWLSFGLLGIIVTESVCWRKKPLASRITSSLRRCLDHEVKWDRAVNLDHEADFELLTLA